MEQTKVFIPIDEKIGDLRGENVWVEVLELRETTEFGPMIKAKLLNNPVLDKSLKWGDEIFAVRQNRPDNRWVKIGKPLASSKK